MVTWKPTVGIAPPTAKQVHVPVLMRLERAPHAQRVVRYLPDEDCFFSEVIWVDGEVPVIENDKDPCWS